MGSDEQSRLEPQDRATDISLRLNADAPVLDRMVETRVLQCSRGRTVLTPENETDPDDDALEALEVVLPIVRHRQVIGLIYLGLTNARLGDAGLDADNLAIFADYLAMAYSEQLLTDEVHRLEAAAMSLKAASALPKCINAFRSTIEARTQGIAIDIERSLRELSSDDNRLAVESLRNRTVGSLRALYSFVNTAAQVVATVPENVLPRLADLSLNELFDTCSAILTTGSPERVVIVYKPEGAGTQSVPSGSTDVFLRLVLALLGMALSREPLDQVQLEVKVDPGLLAFRTTSVIELRLSWAMADDESNAGIVPLESEMEFLRVLGEPLDAVCDRLSLDGGHSAVWVRVTLSQD